MDTLASLPSFEPINSVTPFTTRDNQSYLAILKALQDKVNLLIASINDVAVNDLNNINTLRDAVNASLASVRAELIAMIDALSQGDAAAYDPTTGLRTSPISQVLGNVYDNVRIFAYFAKQYDDKGMTAAEYDALNYQARHFDLAPLYPTLSDTLGA